MYKYLFVLILVLSGCSKSSHINHDDSMMLEVSDSRIQIQIPSDVNLYDRCIRLVDNPESAVEYLTIPTHSQHVGWDEIVYFDITTGKEARRTKIFTEGPNAVLGGAYNYDFINIDTIVIRSKNTQCVYLVNSKGEIVNQCVLSDKEPLILVTLFNSILNVPVAVVNGEIELPCKIPYSRDYSRPNPRSFNFADYPIAYLLDIKDFKLRKSSVHYPKLYENDNNINQDETFSRVFDGNNFVYSYCRYDSILVTSNHIKSELFSAKSRYIGDVVCNGLKIGATREESMKTTLQPQYGNIIYDKYRNVYYRFAYFENDFAGPYNLEYTLCRGRFSIIIIDDKFRVVGETVFPKDTYATKIWFVNREGLWLSENNFQREDMSEDVLSFRCLKLKEKAK